MPLREAGLRRDRTHVMKKARRTMAGLLRALESRREAGLDRTSLQ